MEALPLVEFGAIFAGASLQIGIGRMADSFGLSTSFIVPLVANLFIVSFAVTAHRGDTDESAVEPLRAPRP